MVFWGSQALTNTTLARSIRKEMDIEGNQIEKEVKLSLFVDVSKNSFSFILCV